jgi:hypothetical protein
MMLKSNREQSSQDIIKEEFLQERAAVLGRTGEIVSATLEKLCRIEKIIEERLIHLNQLTELCQKNSNGGELADLKRLALDKVNAEIDRFNRVREYAKLRYYYLIVTRESMGFYQHQWVEDMYRIPPVKKYLQG